MPSRIAANGRQNTAEQPSRCIETKLDRGRASPREPRESEASDAKGPALDAQCNSPPDGQLRKILLRRQRPRHFPALSARSPLSRRALCCNAKKNKKTKSREARRRCTSRPDASGRGVNPG